VKNATLNRSRLIGVRSARLPISHMIKANFKKALNVSTAALMIPAYLQYKDWT
jgi:tRNA (guanine9-N1)-methyltransferase